MYSGHAIRQAESSSTGTDGPARYPPFPDATWDGGNPNYAYADSRASFNQTGWPDITGSHVYQQKGAIDLFDWTTGLRT